MPLTRKDIEKLIPHDGSMVLLDEVLEWENKSILCSTHTHRDPNHPLKNESGLPALTGIEYAAQAMAVHGALSNPKSNETPRSGFLASVKQVRLAIKQLEDLPPDLKIRAQKLLMDESGLIYRFQLISEGREVISGRATVIFAENSSP